MQTRNHHPIVILIPAWAAPLMLPGHFDPATLLPVEGFDLDQTYILLTRNILSGLAPGLIGLFVCSMFAATMSMIDSDINALAAVFTKDVYQRNIRPDLSARALFNAGKLVTVIFGLSVLVTAVIVAYSPGVNKVFSATVKIFGALLSPVAIPLMFGMLWKRTSARGAVLALVGGFLTYAVLVQWTDSFAVYTGGEILVALLIYFGEGLVAKRTPEKEEEVEALFRRLAAD